MTDEKRPTDFERHAAAHASGNLLSDFWYFLRHSKKWWMLPIIVILLLLAGLMTLSSTALAPFIYTLF